MTRYKNLYRELFRYTFQLPHEELNKRHICIFSLEPSSGSLSLKLVFDNEIKYYNSIGIQFRLYKSEFENIWQEYNRIW